MPVEIATRQDTINAVRRPAPRSGGTMELSRGRVVIMVLRRSAGFWLVLANLLTVQPIAWAEELRVMDTGPVNKGVERGRTDEFFVRFNQPVDHIKSEFI